MDIISKTIRKIIEQEVKDSEGQSCADPKKHIEMQAVRAYCPNSNNNKVTELPEVWVIIMLLEGMVT